MSGLYGNVTGGFGMPKMIEIVDESGNTLIGAVTDSEVTFSATRDDVKIGKTFANSEGILEGTDTKTYRTTHASRVVLPGESFSIPLEEYNQYDYTKFQAMIAPFNTTEYDSLSVDKISLHNGVYSVNSSDKLSDVTKNSSLKSIDLNITNDTDNVFIIHYNTYKED